MPTIPPATVPITFDPSAVLVAVLDALKQHGIDAVITHANTEAAHVAAEALLRALDITPGR